MNARQQLILATVFLLLVFTISAAGFVLIEGATPFDAAYMTVITLSTVGFTEVFPLSEMGRLWTIGTIVFGIAAVSLVFSSLVTRFVGEEMRSVMERRKVGKIDQLSGHVIICGYGRVGSMAAQELGQQGRHVVVIEHDTDLRADLERAGYLYVIGDATEEAVLLAAGLKSAAVLVAALHSDADNVYVTLTARGLGPHLQIISRAEQTSTTPKLHRAGADRVVSPLVIGARRIVDIVARPHVVDFFELAAAGVDLELASFDVDAKSDLNGKPLKESKLRERIGGMVVVITRKDGTSLFQPDPDAILGEGDRLLVIGRAGTATRLDQLAGTA